MASSIFRLKAAWAKVRTDQTCACSLIRLVCNPPLFCSILKFVTVQVDSKTTAGMDALKALLSSTQNYKAMRTALHTSQPPCVPYLGMYLTDMTFVEQGNPDTINGLINFWKRYQTGPPR